MLKRDPFMTCNYVTLYNGANGYIVRCTACNTFQFAFLSTMLTMEEEDYLLFKKQVEKKMRENMFTGDANCKNIWLKTQHRGVDMLLTPKELTELNEILESADTEQRTSELLELFRDQSTGLL